MKAVVSNTNLKGMLYSFIIAAIGTFLMHNPESAQITGFWFITFLAISFFAFEPIPNAITAIMLMFSFVIFKIATPDIVFAGWTTFVPWYMVAGLCIGLIVDKTGFAQRISLLIISKIAKTPFLLFLSFFVAGYILNAIVPDGFTTTIVFAMLGLSICSALKLEPNSKASSAIMLTTYFAGMSIGYNFLPNGLGIIGIQMLKEDGFTVTWLQFLIENLSLMTVSGFASMMIAYIYGRTEIAIQIAEASKLAKTELEKMGKVTKREILAVALFISAVASLILEPYHGLNGLFCISAVILLAFFPPINLLEKEDINKLNFGIPIFIAGCMSIGIVAGSLGIPAWLSQQLLPILQQIKSPEMASLFGYISGVLANFVLTPVAASSTLTLPMADLALEMGFTIKPMIYSFFLGLDQWLFPYELAPAIFIYATGYLKIKHLVIMMIPRIILGAILVYFNTIFVWTPMGL